MGDVGGVEPLPGESEADYVARQTRLREEAAARMRTKFGGSGGLNGRMGGVGSGGCGGFGSAQSSSSSGSALAGLGQAAGAAASAGVGIAAVGLATGGWLFGKAKETVVAGASSVATAAGNYRSGSTGSAGAPEEEQSQDISDLLASARLDMDQQGSSGTMTEPKIS